MKSNKNILFLASWYPNKEDPSLGIFIKRHAEAAAIYHNIHVLYVQSLDKIKKPEYNFSEENGVKELKIFYPKSKNKIPLLSKVIKLFRYKKYLNKGLSRIKQIGFKTDIIHLNTAFPAGIVAVDWWKRYKIPYVITEHWTGYLKTDNRFQLNSFQKGMTERIYKNAKRILPVSNNLGEALKNNNLCKKYTTIRNVVNTAVFDNLKLKAHSFLVIADLDDQQKNINGILEAFNELNKNRTDKIKLKIAGGGNHQQFKSNSFIEFLGIVSEQEINKLLNESHALILFSNYENLPCVIIESFATGTPVISTDVGGIPEIINSERGILIEPRNKINLINAVEEILSENTFFNANELRDYAQTNFSTNTIGKQFSVVYNEVLNG